MISMTTSRFSLALVVAFFTHSFVDGQTETCFYKSPLGTHAITINRAQICPLTIEVKR